MSDKSSLKFARTDGGYRLRVEGRGTMRESRPAEAFVSEALGNSDISVVVDLTDCTYLDSTFLGCLMGLNTRFGQPRFRVAMPAELTRKLFGPTRLDHVLKVTADLPEVLCDYVVLPPEAIDTREMKRHLMECHRRLAEVPGPQQMAFAAIAQQMAKELETRA